MRLIGLHFRLKDSLQEALQRAIALSLPTFQCFFIDQAHKKLLHVDAHTQEQFLLFRQKVSHIFIHGSYWINLASLQRSGYKALLREMELADRLACTHLILHPGSAKGAQKKQDGIDQMARLLNHAVRKNKAVRLVLENTMHGNLNVGSNIDDFVQLKSKLDFPERIGFCIDTAHAFSYGYDISDEIKRQEFINQLEEKIGIENIDVIHLNDSHKPLGSRIDKHALIGNGLIGEPALKSFALHPKLKHIPLILEMPLLTHEQEGVALDTVRSWHY